MHNAVAAFLAAHQGLDPRAAVFIFLLSFGFVFPIPEELALVLVGLAMRDVGKGYLGTLFIAFLALGIADSLLFGIARFAGPRVLRLRIARFLLRPEAIRAGERFIEKRGPIVVFGCRFILGLRFAAIVGAGSLRMPYLRFLRYDLPALCIGASAWLGAGYFLGSELGGRLGGIEKALSIAGPLLMAAAFFIVRRSLNRGLRLDPAERKEGDLP